MNTTFLLILVIFLSSLIATTIFYIVQRKYVEAFVMNEDYRQTQFKVAFKDGFIKTLYPSDKPIILIKPIKLPLTVLINGEEAKIISPKKYYLDTEPLVYYISQ